MFAAHGDAVSNAVIMGHASPTYMGYTDFKNGFVNVVQDFEKPVLYLQGDQHKWTLDEEFLGVENLTKVILDRTGPGDPLQIGITDDPDDPFYGDHNFDDSFL
jgi:hypothetical protein